MKVLTHRPCYIEPVVVPEFSAGTSSAIEIKETVPTTQSTEEPAIMPKEATTDSSEGGLVRLKYTFRFREKFDESNDDWLKCIEATSDELLGPYSKAEDNALSTSFGGRGKKRLNRVFDAIGFVYPDYRFPLRDRGKRGKLLLRPPQLSLCRRAKR